MNTFDWLYNTSNYKNLSFGLYIYVGSLESDPLNKFLLKNRKPGVSNSKISLHPEGGEREPRGGEGVFQKKN